MICQQASVIFDKRKFCSRSTWQIDPFSISRHVSIVVIPNQITTAREKLTSPRDRAERWTTEWLVQSRVFGSDKSIIKSDAMSNEYRVTKNSRNSSAMSANFEVPATIWFVIPVSETIRDGTRVSGSIRLVHYPTTSPPRTRTAPISVRLRTADSSDAHHGACRVIEIICLNWIT